MLRYLPPWAQPPPCPAGPLRPRTSSGLSLRLAIMQSPRCEGTARAQNSYAPFRLERRTGGGGHGGSGGCGLARLGEMCGCRGARRRARAPTRRVRTARPSSRRRALSLSWPAYVSFAGIPEKHSCKHSRSGWCWSMRRASCSCCFLIDQSLGCRSLTQLSLML